MFALAPRESAFAWLAVLLACAGLYGVLRMRSFGVALLFGASMAALGLLAHGHTPSLQQLVPPLAVHGLGLLGAGFLLWAALPVGRPMLRYLIGR
jgi:hypothetical protein